MQTPKSKASPIEAPSRTSPKTPRTAQLSKTPGSGSEPVLSSPNKGIKTNKDRSPKVIGRKTPHSPISEKKRQSKASDSEIQIVQLEEDLKQTKDKMISSELLQKQAELEAEEAKKQLSAVTAKLEDTEKQLMEISDMEKSRAQELCKISLDRDDDVAWESELEAAQKQHCADSADPSSAMKEIYKLDVEAKTGVDQFRLRPGQLEAAMGKNEAYKLDDNLNAVNDYNTIASELEESKAKVNALEMLVSKLQSKLVTYGDGETGMNEHSAGDIQHCQENEEIEQLKSEIMNLKYEDSKLRASLEAAELRYQEVRFQSTLEIRSAYELVESGKLDLKCKEAELRQVHSDMKELQAKLVDHEARLQTYAEQELRNNAENNQRKQLEFHFRALQEALSDKENLVQSMEKENEILKTEVQKWEMEKRKASDGSDADTLAEARAAEQKALSKFEYLTEESDKNSKRTARVIEQLDAAQAANAELESELRKLKVQSDQWRKAAEAAAAMLTSGNNGKYIDRTGSLDSSYHTLGGRISSPFSDDLNEESGKKKNGNMLKKIGVLWKKGQNQK